METGISLSPAGGAVDGERTGAAIAADEAKKPRIQRSLEQIFIVGIEVTSDGQPIRTV
jgi:hypothetical protein